MSYHSEAAKVRDMPNVMQYVVGRILDIGCGPDKITPEAFGVDGRKLDGVDHVTDNPYLLANPVGRHWDTVFSSHFLEHLQDQFGAILEWRLCLEVGGHIVLYLPDGRHYDNKENPEHMIDMKYDDFMFWFKRSFCGEGKDFRGENLPKLFELVDSGMDVGQDRYSFYVVARRV
jgi:hypothetical protein